MKNILYTFSFLLATSAVLSAQTTIFIDTSYSAEQMVMDFFDNSCVTPSNVTFSGGDISLAFFEGANTELGLNAGIVLSTGDVTQLAQPADVFISTAWQTPGDSLLGDLIDNVSATFDAAILEFDILVAEDGELDFQYVFGSEEYPEYVGSLFNDVFAFWVDESGFLDPENIATIPGTTDAVAINTVNDMMNANYYVDYQGLGGQDLVFDGFTTPLPATFTALGNNMYHVKIAIGDAGDQVFDSGVFIGVESLCGPMLLEPPTSFTLQQDGNTVTVENESRYATSWHWDYGNGHTTTDRHPEPYEYPAPGMYTVTLTTENYCCTNTYSFDVEIEGTVSTSEVVERPFILQPNPASDYILLENISTSEMTYVVADPTGRQIFAGNVQGAATIDMTSMPSGIYLVQVYTEDRFFVERVIKK